MTTWLRDRMTPVSRVKYLAWRAARAKGPAWVRLHGGNRIELRPIPSTDLDTAYEIFASECYRLPRPIEPSSVKTIVDLGANVGYSVLHWLGAFPSAHIVAVEPHPVHCGQIRRHLEANHVQSRVRLIEAAAGPAAGNVTLSDHENTSSIVAAENGIAVPMVDVFAATQGIHVDLLKMDIEGAEYAILADRRFVAWRPSAVVMEWHAVAAGPSGPEWCVRRFAEMGYIAERTWDADGHGLIWAFPAEDAPRPI